MRYIKKYNVFSINENMDKNSDNEFFKKVDISEFRKSRPALSKEESVIIFNKLKSIFSDVEFDELESISFRSLNFIKDTTDNISFNAEKIGVDILLYDDEWFGVSIVHFGKGKQEYYMCDQFEGLIKLLKLKLSDEEKVMESKLDRPNYKKLDIDGFIVYQGKDAKSNDYVTFELSDDEDYWFHAHNFAGSHLLLKIKDKLPQNETIKKVAELAAKNSKAPNGDVVVVWSKKKFIKKERAMNPGQVKVDYINSNKITIRK